MQSENRKNSTSPGHLDLTAQQTSLDVTSSVQRHQIHLLHYLLKHL